MIGQWRQRARSCIADCCLVFADTNRCVVGPSLSDSDKHRLIEMVRKAYPFGPRDMYPYTVWLSEMKRFRAFLDGKPVSKYGAVAKPLEDPAQGSLL